MEKMINRYLEKVEKCLKPLPVSERIDIVKEIKSEILELQRNGKDTAEIIERLGNPREAAGAYLGDLAIKDAFFSGNRAFAFCAWYSIASLSGLIVIPTLAICAPVCILCGIVTPILGAFKLIDALLNAGNPFAVHIVVVGIQDPFIVFTVSVITGVVLYLAGIGCWKLLVCYIRGMGKVKNTLWI